MTILLFDALVILFLAVARKARMEWCPMPARIWRTPFGIVPANHRTYDHPAAMAEVKRILKLHLSEARPSAKEGAESTAWLDRFQ